MLCDVLSRSIALYCTVLYCTVLYSTVLYCTVLYCTVLYYTVLYYTVLYCTVLYCTELYCTVQHCTVLYCTVLRCYDMSSFTTIKSSMYWSLISLQSFIMYYIMYDINGKNDIFLWYQTFNLWLFWNLGLGLGIVGGAAMAVGGAVTGNIIFLSACLLDVWLFILKYSWIRLFLSHSISFNIITIIIIILPIHFFSLCYYY